MKSKMTECYDYTQLEVPEELRHWRFPESDIDRELEALARDYSTEEETEDGIENGYSVRCVCVTNQDGSREGRTVLLFPGRSLPGAEEAEKAVLGRKKGEEFDCVIRGKKLRLRVELVLKKNVVEAGDEKLFAMLNLPDVRTEEDYRRWYHKEHDKEYRDKASIRICQFWLEEIMEKSRFYVDEAEKKEWCESRAKMMYLGFEAAGVDPGKQQDGTVLTKEGALEKMALEQERYYIPNVIYCYFCEKDGFAVTEEDYEKLLEQMAAQRSESVENLRKQGDFELYKGQRYQEHTFHILMKEAEKYLEV
ncbi:hypothetical protein NE683_00900 [Bariatricus massiliensis]|uniref:Uncharacterized protein n=1 Tax=Bariatricus massiliensis TaxID=1745713 RepID=A0ABS8DEI3_9FIRM|nr:hypothetical protein [Bariatricus massiliensis]MCB7302899.1 hypothetical protein [Bariatricus massiliensis]MCB7374115.1 hypothetical protein [Bariatricus massiliensis]MCB7386785.1 hypothetical protein [Bariatricus massiliensis]MCB7410947.1 hypothetical protein [Bariatricus massiliensis]MCQ5251773.1 hypothetical protein [Bariatricus massiliensis]